jgi:hypothetical protein
MNKIGHSRHFKILVLNETFEPLMYRDSQSPTTVNCMIADIKDESLVSVDSMQHENGPFFYATKDIGFVDR